MTKGGSVILRLYFALAAFVSLFTLAFGVIDLLNLSLKTFVFPAADRPAYTVACDLQYQTQEQCDRQQADAKEQALVQKQQDAVRDISLVIVMAPLFWLHFRTIYKEMTEKEA